MSGLFRTLIIIAEYSIVVVIAMETTPGDMLTGSTTSAVMVEWTVDTFPNPQIDYAECGMLNEQGWVCDPGFVLTSEEISSVSGMVDDIYSTSMSDCSSSSGGYITSIALVPSLDSFQGSGWYNTSSLTVGDDIASVIRESIWQFSQCGDDLLILIFIQESELYISMGDSVSELFDNDEELISKIQIAISNNVIYDALMLQLSYIQTALNDDTYVPVTIATDDNNNDHHIITRPVKQPELTTPVLASIIFISVAGGLTCIIGIYVSNRNGYFTLPRRFRGLGWGPGWGMGWGMAMQGDQQQHQHHPPDHDGSPPNEPPSSILTHHRYSQTTI